MSAGPLVETKLYAPRLRPAVVGRPRLSAQLGRGADCKLTLLSAPAGFGKTTVLAEWLAAPTRGPRAVAWLSLDESDRQATTFWTYLLTAVQTAVPGVGAGALALLQAASAPVEAVLATLLNELRAVPPELYLVLDDYHLVDGPEIQAGVAFLLEHLPSQVHLMISTRADPALPLARLRARDELVEVRAADLRFTTDEAAAYLNQHAGLDLTVADVSALEERTEGWIAALQLAALSLRGRPDAPDFIAGFTGDDRYVVDYLVDEVLARQPENVRSFLFQTSILDRLSGPLCDAVTGQRDGAAALEALDRGNLFMVALDDHRRWYRYHHLFGDVLHAHLLAQGAEVVRTLHRRASGWYEQNGEPVPAVRHALAAGEAEGAAALAEAAIPALRRHRQEATIRSWIDAFPPDVVRVRPVLQLGFVGALMATAEAAGLEDRLQAIEHWLPPAGERPAGWTPPAGMVVADEAELARLPGGVELYRTGLALLGGDLRGVLRHAALVRERATEDDHVVRGGASALAGLALWAGGDLEGAHRAYSDCVDRLRRAGHISDVLGCSIALADLRITQGRLTEAAQTYEEALRLAAHEDGRALRGTADMHVGLSGIAWERNDLAAAGQQLQRAAELGEQLGLPQHPYRWRVATARLREARGDLDGALALLEEAQPVYVGDFSPDVRPVPASRARLLVAMGRLDAALDWVRGRGLDASDELTYLHEFEHVTLARVLLVRSRVERSEPLARQTAALVQRLLLAAEAGERTGSVIELLVLQALTRQDRGDDRGAAAALERGLTLAEPERYRRVFVGEGPTMRLLLASTRRRRPRWDYVGYLLDAYGEADGAAGRGPAETRGPGPVEPLSGRELEVLRLLASDLDGPGIARQLFVSVNTLRTHTRSIYAKLGVNSRRAAVHRARDLDLLARTVER